MISRLASRKIRKIKDEDAKIFFIEWKLRV